MKITFLNLDILHLYNSRFFSPKRKHGNFSTKFSVNQRTTHARCNKRKHLARGHQDLRSFFGSPFVAVLIMNHLKMQYI